MKQTAPAARRLSSLREAEMVSCGSSKLWRKSFQKNKKMKYSSTKNQHLIVHGTHRINRECLAAGPTISEGIKDKTRR